MLITTINLANKESFNNCIWKEATEKEEREIMKTFFKHKLKP